MPIPPSLRLYCDQNQFCDFYSRNLIAPPDIIPLFPGTRPLSAIRSEALFVTHVNVAMEERGLGDGLSSGFRFPVTLEIAPPKNEELDNPVLLVAKVESGELSVVRGSWRDYDIEKHVGAFLFGEIPLSRVKGIVFDRPEDRERLFRPSPDLWFPESKYKVMGKPLTGASPFKDLASELIISDEDV